MLNGPESAWKMWSVEPESCLDPSWILEVSKGPKGSEDTLLKT